MTAVVLAVVGSDGGVCVCVHTHGGEAAAAAPTQRTG